MFLYSCYRLHCIYNHFVSNWIVGLSEKNMDASEISRNTEDMFFDTCLLMSTIHIHCIVLSVVIRVSVDIIFGMG